MQQQSSSVPRLTEESFSPDDKRQLSVILSQICKMQKAYGKTAFDLETIVSGFLMFMEEYHMADILRGLKEYMKLKNDIPAPSDIIAIIDPPPEPLSQAMYIRICKKVEDGYTFVSDAEYTYKSRFEQNELGKLAR